MKYVVVGGGIIGLAVARQLVRSDPSNTVVVLDKEVEVARHQTGHNSGVMHAGLYYQPGSMKARLCRRGIDLMKRYCLEHGVPFQEVGKLVVAVDPSELPRLAEIERRAMENGVADVRTVSAAELREIEPHAAGIAALHSPSTAIVDYAAVSRALAAELELAGVEIRLGCEVQNIVADAARPSVETTGGDLIGDRVIVCAGLQSARLARRTGDDPDPQIVPFRGEYYRLRPDRSDLVRGLIYPVPDPRYPFLGIHLTRRIDGGVDVGPNAVLALALEGYRRRDVSLPDLAETLTYAGFRAMARQHWRTGAREMLGSVSKRYFLHQARRYLPELTLTDLQPAPAGVRAQAVRRDGTLVDDFWISQRGPVTFVRNAPSPAATSSLAIAEHVSAVVLSDAPA
jgi:L-2-hydroxyglutarate oxidase LhgO